MRQRWHDLLFAHWRVPPDAVRPLLPPALELDMYDGDAWIGVIPFHMTGVRLRGLPPLPTTHAFAELNVRTYVTHQGRPGVWFFSLDAASMGAVVGARIGARLPYFRATMAIARESSSVHYRSRRWALAGRPAAFTARYRSRPEAVPVRPGSLEWFLVERYSLYAAADRRVWRGDLHHRRWCLYDADADITENTMPQAAGLPALGTPPLLHYAAFQDVRFWWPKLVVS